MACHRTVLTLFVVAAASWGAAQTVASKRGSWSISVAYPKFCATGDIGRRAAAESAKHEKADYQRFLSEAQKDVPEMRKAGLNVQYTLKVVPFVATDRPWLASGYVEREAYTGGAHANRSYRALNFARVGGRVTDLSLHDLFAKGTDAISVASKAIRERVLRLEQPPSSIASGGWRRLSAGQAKQFVVTATGLVFLFGQGEVSAESAGPIQIFVPFRELSGLDRSGVLKPLLTYTQGEPLAELRRGRWHLVSIEMNDDKVVRAEDDGRNWIEFGAESVKGRAGINRFQGKYTLSADRRITVGTLAMTRAANPPGSASEAFEQRIAEVTSFLLKDGLLILELPMDAGVLVLRR